MMSLYLAQISWLHRIPAGLKLFCLAIATVMLYPIKEVWIISSAVVITLGIYASLGRSGLAQLKLLKPLFWMMLAIFALQYWTMGLIEAWVLLGRMLVLILLANAISMTTRMDEMNAVFQFLLTPLRWLGVQTQRIAFALSLLIRFVPVLVSFMHALLAAWRARGGQRRYWQIIAPLVVQALRMSDQVAEAVAARGGIKNINN